MFFNYYNIYKLLIGKLEKMAYNKNIYSDFNTSSTIRKLLDGN
jgi:hypothetical protein